MKNKFLPALIFVSVLFFPLTSFAASCGSGTPDTFAEVVCLFVSLITAAIPIVAGIALLVFFWGLAKFILKAGDEGAREEGKQVMKWGIISLFVLVSIWGIVLFFARDFFGWGTIGVPKLPTGGQGLGDYPNQQCIQDGTC